MKSIYIIQTIKNEIDDSNVTQYDCATSDVGYTDEDTANTEMEKMVAHRIDKLFEEVDANDVFINNKIKGMVVVVTPLVSYEFSVKEIKIVSK